MKRNYWLNVLLLSAMLGFSAGDYAETSAQSTAEPTFAVLPFFVPGEAKDYVHVIMKSLYDVVEDMELFVPAYSYYPGDGRYSPEAIPAGQLQPGEISRLWKRKSFFAPWEPNDALVFEIGERLGVDGVLLYSVQILGRGNDRIQSFLYHIKDRRVLTKGVVDEIKHNFTNEILTAMLSFRIRQVTADVFYKF